MQNLKDYIQTLIAKGELWRFYKSKEWIALKTSVLVKFNYECQVCKARGKITRYEPDKQGKMKLISTVHHVQYVRNHPELALSEFYFYNGDKKRNLIPVCKMCHNILHPEKHKAKKQQYVNEERW